MSRDPIAEQGGKNLIAFLDNNTLDKYDNLGLFGKINILLFQPSPRNSDGSRKWAFQAIWLPPKEWKSMKNKCVPCKKVIWVQTWTPIITFFGLGALNWGTVDDINEENFKKSGYAWEVGKTDGARLSDTPGLSRFRNDLGIFVFSFHYDFRSSAMCVSGNDSGKSYGTIKWSVSWSLVTDNIEAFAEIAE